MISSSRFFLSERSFSSFWKCFSRSNLMRSASSFCFCRRSASSRSLCSRSSACCLRIFSLSWSSFSPSCFLSSSCCCASSSRLALSSAFRRANSSFFFRSSSSFSLFSWSSRSRCSRASFLFFCKNSGCFFWVIGPSKWLIRHCR